jgi:hypothetical protein
MRVPPAAPRYGTPDAEPSGMDIVALLLAFGFFAACWGFVALCERLQG